MFISYLYVMFSKQLTISPINRWLLKFKYNYIVYKNIKICLIKYDIAKSSEN